MGLQTGAAPSSRMPKRTRTLRAGGNLAAPYVASVIEDVAFSGFQRRRSAQLERRRKKRSKELQEAQKALEKVLRSAVESGQGEGELSKLKIDNKELLEALKKATTEVEKGTDQNASKSVGGAEVGEKGMESRGASTRDGDREEEGGGETGEGGKMKGEGGDGGKGGAVRGASTKLDQDGEDGNRGSR